ncbi:hypothetical protein [Virgisporangium aurantiacum]|uniref:hypothetical protein n=1 Tax=Virgisporangium aurantiacum TaxID=175570 RepID=UPI001EF18B9F|nr:hypothetical protein [Virgisporangium aurantiacum]
MNHEQVLELITAREAVAATQAEQLRAQIAALTEQLVVVDAELADLATTRDTLLRLTGATTRGTSPTDATVTIPVTSRSSPCSPPPEIRYAQRTSASRSVPAPPRRTPKACAPNSNASSPATFSPNSNPACSPSPGPRLPAALTQHQSHNGHQLPNHHLSFGAGDPEHGIGQRGGHVVGVGVAEPFQFLLVSVSPQV